MAQWARRTHGCGGYTRLFRSGVSVLWITASGACVSVAHTSISSRARDLSVSAAPRAGASSTRPHFSYSATVRSRPKTATGMRTRPTSRPTAKPARQRVSRRHSG